MELCPSLPVVSVFLFIGSWLRTTTMLIQAWAERSSHPHLVARHNLRQSLHRSCHTLLLPRPPPCCSLSHRACPIKVYLPSLLTNFDIGGATSTSEPPLKRQRRATSKGATGLTSLRLSNI